MNPEERARWSGVSQHSATAVRREGRALSTNQFSRHAAVLTECLLEAVSNAICASGYQRSRTIQGGRVPGNIQHAPTVLKKCMSLSATLCTKPVFKPWVPTLLASLGRTGRRRAVLGHSLNTQTLTKTDEQKKAVCDHPDTHRHRIAEKPSHSSPNYAVALWIIF